MPDDHDYQTCGDKNCERYPCKIYKEGWRDGYDEGYPEGYADGAAAGFEQGFAAAQASCSCG